MYRVDNSSHENREDDVAVKVASLRDGSGHDGGAGGNLKLSFLLTQQLYYAPGGSKCALEKHEGIVLQLQADQAEVRVTNELRASPEGESIAKKYKGPGPYEELCKISNAREAVKLMVRRKSGHFLRLTPSL